ncbi:MAG: CRTAC1 family protein [Candidatus Latescibacterota bacterium]
MNARAAVLAAGTALALCGPAAGQVHFVDVTDSVFAATPFVCRSVSWGDGNNDGRVDLLLGDNWVWAPGAGALAVWEQEGGFADRSAVLPPGPFPQRRRGGSGWGDFDNDGDLDVFVASGACGPFCGGGGPSPNHLLRNDRGRYLEVTRAAGLVDSLPTDNALWLDYDRDGLLDLYTGNLWQGIDDDLNPANDSESTLRNKLYRNQGDGTFADVTARAGLDLQLDPLRGGSNGGMTAADLNDDGWPDLYLGVYGNPNRLFLNDGRGGFRDATTPEIGDRGAAFDVTVGDIDNDGDLDLFQAAGGSVLRSFRSLLLLNLGGGQFADITESAGRAGPLTARELQNARFGDLDNDGDLDLLTGWPHLLYLNDGTGFFTEATAGSRIAGDPGFLALGDYDRDGFLDACFGLLPVLGTSAFGGLYRNQGAGNYWLEVELVGLRSNRQGIGARVIATAGSRRQTREVLSGQGYSQDEVMAHFGLGERTQVDELEVRWPSGQVDVLAGVPADQRVRLFEGEPTYWAVRTTGAAWEWPDSVVLGQALDARLSVWPAPFAPGSRVTQVTVDLSWLGGPQQALVQESADGPYRAAIHLSTVSGLNGVWEVPVTVDQATLAGPYWTRLSRTVVVVPGEDLVLLGDRLAEGWETGSAGEPRRPSWPAMGPWRRVGWPPPARWRRPASSAGARPSAPAPR